MNRARQVTILATIASLAVIMKSKTRVQESGSLMTSKITVHHARMNIQTLQGFDLRLVVPNLKVAQPLGFPGIWCLGNPNLFVHEI